jgi:hypothetical protein
MVERRCVLVSRRHLDGYTLASLPSMRESLFILSQPDICLERGSVLRKSRAILMMVDQSLDGSGRLGKTRVDGIDRSRKEEQSMAMSLVPPFVPSMAVKCTFPWGKQYLTCLIHGRRSTIISSHVQIEADLRASDHCLVIA